MKNIPVDYNKLHFHKVIIMLFFLFSVMSQNYKWVNKDKSLWNLKQFAL